MAPGQDNGFDFGELQIEFGSSESSANVEIVENVQLLRGLTGPAIGGELLRFRCTTLPLLLAPFLTVVS